MFSFYCAGIRISDLVMLDVTNVAGGKLEYTMRKNGKKMAFPLSEKAQAIAEKYIAEAREAGREKLFGLVPEGLEDKMAIAKSHPRRHEL